MRLLDTDVLIDLFRGHPPAVAWLAHQMEDLYTSGYSALELYSGCCNKREVDNARILLSQLIVIWPGNRACDEALTLFPSRHLRFNIGPLDALIGACALEYNAVLYTFNAKYFQAIPEITVRQPYIR